MAQPDGPRGNPGASSQRKQQIVLLNAFTRPMAAAVVAVTIIVAALTQFWWFLLIGAAVYAFLVWSALNDQKLTAQVLAEELYPQRKLDLSRLQGAYRDAVQRALTSRQRIEQAVASAQPDSVRASLVDSVQQVVTVTETIYDIARKAQDLQTSLGQTTMDLGPLNQEISQLDYQIKYATDDYLKSQYQATLDAKQQQMQNLRDANQALIRWQAQLDNALSALDTIYSQILKIKSSEVRNLTAATDQVSQSLKQQINDLQITSQAFDQVYGGSAAPAVPPAPAAPADGSTTTLPPHHSGKH